VVHGHNIDCDDALLTYADNDGDILVILTLLIHVVFADGTDCDDNDEYRAW